MNKKILLIGVFLCCFFAISAQETIIEGNVIDSRTGTPIVDAVFVIETTTIRQKTNEDGIFYINKNIPVGEFTASVTKEGYIPRKFIIVIKEGNKATINTIRMTGLSKKQLQQTLTLPPSNLLELGTSITGTIRDSNTSEVVPDAWVSIVGTDLKQKTDMNGNFLFDYEVPSGKQTLEIYKKDYLTAQQEIDIIGKKTGIVKGIMLQPNLRDMENILINTYAHDELYTEFETIENTSRFYQNTSSLFLTTATSDFSPTFFKLRGQDASAGTTLINGVAVNSITNGKPEWSTFAGLEEVTQNADFSRGLSASNYAFGGVNGTQNINTFASQYRKGGKVSYQFSNRSFIHGANVSYATGMSDSGWALALSASKRIAPEGYYEGVTYDLSSFFLSIEKKINEQHRFGLTGIFTPTIRDKYAANTQEIFDLKGDTYNPYWGLQNDDKRNARSRDVSNPILMLSHLWTIRPKATLQTSVAASFGTVLESRLDNFGADLDAAGDIITPRVDSPNPVVIDKLPSFFLRDTTNPDRDGAAAARTAFLSGGQIDWRQLYAINANPDTANASYILYEDVQENLQLDFNTVLTLQLNDFVSLNGALGYTSYNADNFAQIKDLLGTKSYLDINPLDGVGTALQSDLENLNRRVTEGEFRYNYRLKASKIKAFGQVQYKKEAFGAFLGITANLGNYSREGLYKNGASFENSLGMKEISMTDFGIKAGLDYEIAKNHILSFKTRYTSEAPTLNNLFYNARENNNLLENLGDELIPLNSETTIATSLEYHYEGAKLELDFLGYFTSVSDAMQSSLFEETTIGTLSSNSIKQVLTGINEKYLGLEIAIAYKITDQLTLQGVAALGDNRYDNSPNLSYVFNESTVLDLGESALEGVHIAGGPEQALSLGLSYNNDAHWWIGIKGNYFANNFTIINPYRRTTAFFEDSNGNTFANFTTTDAKKILTQEQLEDYFLVNLSGGKFWKIKNTYAGFKIGVNNITGQSYNIGGFEQTSIIKYDELLIDSTREQPLYGAKFWKGYSTNYFANVFYRF